MENHLFPALGNCPLEKLSTIQIQRAINEMRENGRTHYDSHIPLKDTTLSTYVHSTPSMRAQAADTIGQMIAREVG